MRERQVFVDPGSAWNARRRELTRGEHDLSHLSIDFVAIVVDRSKVVVRANLLDLREGFEERLVVPQTNVVDRCPVVVDVGHREVLFTSKFSIDDVIQPIGFAGCHRCCAR